MTVFCLAWNIQQAIQYVTNTADGFHAKPTMAGFRNSVMTAVLVAQQQSRWVAVQQHPSPNSAQRIATIVTKFLQVLCLRRVETSRHSKPKLSKRIWGTNLEILVL